MEAFLTSTLYEIQLHAPAGILPEKRSRYQSDWRPVHPTGCGKEDNPASPRSGRGWSNGVHSWTRHRTSGVIMIIIMSARWYPRSVKYRTREPVSLLCGGCLLVRVITVRPQTIDIAISYIDIP